MAELAGRKKSAEALACKEKAPDLNPGDWPAFRGQRARWPTQRHSYRHRLEQESAKGTVASSGWTRLGFVHRD